MRGSDGWIGVDLDGVLCVWDPIYLPGLGPPIPSMIERVKGWLATGEEVRIFTARVTSSEEEPAWRDEARRLINSADPNDWVNDQTDRIDAFCREHFGRALPITASKDWRLRVLWDDRAVAMIMNTGLTKDEWRQSGSPKVEA